MVIRSVSSFFVHFAPHITLRFELAAKFTPSETKSKIRERLRDSNSIGAQGEKVCRPSFAKIDGASVTI